MDPAIPLTQDEREWLAPELEREADFRELMASHSMVPDLHKARALALRALATALRAGEAIV